MHSCWKHLQKWTVLVLLYLNLTWIQASMPLVTIEEYACFNSVLDIRCRDEEIIVFHSARYGRNDTTIADKCGTPYQRNCDVDAHFTLNRLCAGKQTCAVAVNSELFSDPCGYKEFLQVTYRCIPVGSIYSSCQGQGSPRVFDHGYITSPNYPKKYYMDAECTWDLSVQKRQSIKITIFDFELDVKRNARCYDFLEIKNEQTQFFKDCGALGKQEIGVDANQVTVHFKTEHNSLTQRGFFIYFEAIGPGCPDIPQPQQGHVTYEMDNNDLWANVTCDTGFHFEGTDEHFIRLQCQGSTWSGALPLCVPTAPPTSPTNPTTTGVFAASDTLASPGSIIGIALGVVSAILLIALLLVLSLYLHRTRRKAERKLDQWRVVINNLQENAMNEDGDGVHDPMMDNISISKTGTPANSNNRKAKRGKKKQNYNEDDLQGRNLLSGHYLDEDDYEKDPGNYYKIEGEYANIPRRASKVGKFSLTRSREGELESPYDTCCGSEDHHYSRIPARTRPKHKRARSGVFERVPSERNNGIYMETIINDKRLITQSAPDLLEALAREVKPILSLTEVKTYETEVPNCKIARSSTLGAVTSHRTLRQMGSRCNSRSKIRC